MLVNDSSLLLAHKMYRTILDYVIIKACLNSLKKKNKRNALRKYDFS